MIISASRRTDIPRFYSDWFINRIRAGYCTYPNPFNRKQIVRVSLKLEDVDVIVFWTKNPRPLMRYLQELDSRGYRYYFQFTVNGYPRQVEPRVPTLEERIETFKELSRMVTPRRVIWRYDPILWSSAFGEEYHYNVFARIAASLQGYTDRVVISLVDDYRGAWKRMASIEGLVPCTPENPAVASLLARLARCAAKSRMEIVSCAESYDLQRFGIKPGKCVDDALIQQVFGIRVSAQKDSGQRPACGCVLSRDIGVYGTCRHGCIYCYAAGLPGIRLEPHDPASPSLVGHYEAEPTLVTAQGRPRQASRPGSQQRKRQQQQGQQGQQTNGQQEQHEQRQQTNGQQGQHEQPQQPNGQQGQHEQRQQPHAQQLPLLPATTEVPDSPPRRESTFRPRRNPG